MAMRIEGSKTSGTNVPMPDAAMAATNGVDITETVLSVTTIKLMERDEAYEIARIVLMALMEAARSKQDGEASIFVMIDEFQELAKSDEGQPQ
jgi:hypothetical protein